MKAPKLQLIGSIKDLSALLDSIKRVISQIQEFFDSSLDPFLNDKFLKGTLVTASLVTGQDNLVAHKLGYKYSGYIVVDQNAQADIWTSATANNKTLYINLKCSADVDVTLRCF